VEKTTGLISVANMIIVIAEKGGQIVRLTSVIECGIKSTLGKNRL
jgi:hypothetical protein